MLRGSTILPELIRQNRDEYVVLLREADAAAAQGQLSLDGLHAFLGRLLEQQLASAAEDGERE
jgi:hypothetical protein